METGQLSFFLYNAVKPSLALCAEQLSAYLPETAGHDEGYCPVCGGAPALAILGGEAGKRSFNCARCTHTWEVNRRFCPHCNNRESKTLGYFYAETEKEFRVDICDQCKKYIKTVDTRDLPRKIYPPMELVATLHLDMKATENGYTSGAAEGHLQ
ncbi:MAG: formate dehydrogenase accessory protein FdhE [Chromatiales bacterium]|nr:formate dehydrogenase accessory protein FdhE [Chromatiales bacterium]